MKKIIYSFVLLLSITAVSCIPKGDGDCKGEPKEGVCIMVVDPVCGCDGITYNNECEAGRAGVLSYTKGACEKDTSTCKGAPLQNVACTEQYDPVCGCDGKTYGNECEAKVAGVKSYTKGACNQTSDCQGKPLENVFCTTEYDPVCGCDGKTYSNECTAKASGIKSYTKGACNK